MKPYVKVLEHKIHAYRPQNGLGVQGLGFSGLGFRVQGFGGLGFKVGSQYTSP